MNGIKQACQTCGPRSSCLVYLAFVSFEFDMFGIQDCRDGQGSDHGGPCGIWILEFIQSSQRAFGYK